MTNELHITKGEVIRPGNPKYKWGQMLLLIFFFLLIFSLGTTMDNVPGAHFFSTAFLTFVLSAIILLRLKFLFYKSRSLWFLTVCVTLAIVAAVVFLLFAELYYPDRTIFEHFEFFSLHL